MKTIDDALELRGRIFGAFEMAELEPDDAAREPWLTFAIVGAGPTGVELAGQIAELSRRALGANFRRFDPATARIVLLDALDTVLPSYPERLRRRARRDLERLGVEVRLGTRVVGVDEAGLDARGRAASRHARRSGRQACRPRRSDGCSPIAPAPPSTAPVASRWQPDCSLPGHPEVFVVGDLMALNGLPGLAEVAMQSGHHAARTIVRRLRGRPTKPFRYLDLGTMATISRFRAVVSIGRLRVAGFVGWLMWLVVHLAFLTGFKNRVRRWPTGRSRSSGAAGASARSPSSRCSRARARLESQTRQPATPSDHLEQGGRAMTERQASRHAPCRTSSARRRSSRWARCSSRSSSRPLFAACIIGTYHKPHPNDIKVGVVGPPAQTAPLRAGLEKAAGSAFDISQVATVAEAAHEVRQRDLNAAFVPTANPKQPATVIVASANGRIVATAAEALARAVTAAQGAQLVVREVRPLPSGDEIGLGVFMFMIVCTICGYIAPTILETFAPALRPAAATRSSRRRPCWCRRSST